MVMEYWLASYHHLQANLIGNHSSLDPSMIPGRRYDQRTNRVNKRRCVHLHSRFQVTPGASWGTMDTSLQNEWMQLRCDEFFCKPDSRSGRGVYRCIPMPAERQ